MSQRTSSRNTTVVAAVAFAGFAAVLLAVEALAVHGQVDFGRHVLGLDGAYVYVVPIALEGGTLVAAALALWATLTGDSTVAHRAWTYVFLGAAAAANWIGALAAGRSWIAAAYLAAMCVAALRMWHAILHRIRRAELRKAGAVEQPLPRFRGLRWLPGIAFKETLMAWKVAIREEITSPREALALVRGGLDFDEPTEFRAGDDLHSVDWQSFPTKRAATEKMADCLGTYDVQQVRQALAEVGITTDHSTTVKNLRDLQARRDLEERERRRQLMAAVPAATEG